MLHPIDARQAVAQAIEEAERKADRRRTGRIDLKRFLNELFELSSLPRSRTRYIEAALLEDARVTFGGSEK